MKPVPWSATCTHEQTCHAGHHFIEHECPRHLWRAVRRRPTEHQHPLMFHRQQRKSLNHTGQRRKDRADSRMLQLSRRHNSLRLSVRYAVTQCPSLVGDGAAIETAPDQLEQTSCARKSGHVSALLIRPCVRGFVRTQALVSRLELSSRSRSVRSGRGRVSRPCRDEAQNGPSP